MPDNKKESQPRTIESSQGVVESPKPAEQQPAVESWMQKIERRFARVPNNTPTPTDDTVVVQQSQSQQPPVTLPINQTQMQVGQKSPVEEGITWLVSWVIRQIKMLHKLGRRTRLSDMPEIKE